MRRAIIILFLLSPGAAVAYEPWQSPQNTGGFCAAPTMSIADVVLEQSDGMLVCGPVPIAFVSAPTGSGVAEVTSGVWNPAAYQCLAGEIQYGAASGGQLAQSANLTWDDTNGVEHVTGSVNGQMQVHVANTNTGAAAIAAVQLSSSATINTPPYANFSFTGTGTAGPGDAFFVETPSVNGQTLNFLNVGGGSTNNILFGTTGSATTRLTIENGGNIDVANLPNGMVKAAGGIGTLAPAVAGTDYQAPISWPANGDVVFIASGLPAGVANFTFASNILKVGDGTTSTQDVSIGTSSFPGAKVFWKDATPTLSSAIGNEVPGVAAGGDLVMSTYNGAAWSESARWLNGTNVLRVTNQANPATPASGFQNCYGASTGNVGASNVLACRNSAGTVNHLVKSQTCGSHAWTAATNDDGTLTCTQPAFSDVSGTIACAQYSLGTGLTCSGGVLDAANPAGAGSTFGSSTTVIQKFTVDGYGNTQSATAVTATGIFTKLKFSCLLSQAANIAQAAVTENAGDPATGAFDEYPNDFLAGHIQVRANLATNAITGGTITFFASRNGAGIAGTGISFTSASSTGVTVGTQIGTGSGSASDTYGLNWSTSAGYTGGFNRVTFEMVLTP